MYHLPTVSIYFFILPCTSWEPLSLGDLLTFSTSCSVFIFTFSFCGEQRAFHFHRNTKALRHPSPLPRHPCKGFVIHSFSQCPAQMLQKGTCFLEDSAQTTAVKQHGRSWAENSISIVHSKSPDTPFTPRLQKKSVEESLLLS